MNGPSIIIWLAIFVLSVSCNSISPNNNYKLAANEFFQVYQEKRDFNKFMNFYAEEAVLLDMINGDKIVGRKNIKEFFQWDNPNIEKNDSGNLFIEEQIAEDKVVVTKGYFRTFKWQGEQVEAMNFITILHFDENGLIAKQEDWINYPSTLIDYNSRKNSNEWILGEGAEN